MTQYTDEALIVGIKNCPFSGEQLLVSSIKNLYDKQALINELDLYELFIRYKSVRKRYYFTSS